MFDLGIVYVTNHCIYLDAGDGWMFVSTYNCPNEWCACNRIEYLFWNATQRLGVRPCSI